MKRALILSLMIAMQVVAFAQAPNVKVTWGDLGTEKFFKLTTSFYVLGSVNNTVVVQKSLGNKDSYLMYDQNLKFVKNVDFGKAYSGLKREYANDGTYFTDDKAFQVYRENKFAEDGTTPTYFTELDLNTLQHKEKVEVGKRKPNKPYQWNFMGYYIRQSEDRTKFAFIGNDREYRLLDGEGSYDFQIVVFDSQLKKIQEKTWSFPKEANKIEIESVVVDNEGNVFVQAKVKSKEWKKATGMDYQLVVVSSPVVGDATHLSFDEGENTIESLSLAALGGGKIVGGGLYSAGTFFISYDANNAKGIVKKFTPFTDQLKAGMMAGAKKAELPDLYLDAVEATAEGGLIVISEQRVPEKQGSNGAITPGSANNILIVRYSETGKVIWETNVLKKQRMGVSLDFSEMYYSYIHSFDGKTLRLLFNDDALNINNYDPTKVALCKGFNDATAVLAEVDLATGNYKKTAIFKATETGFILYPMASEAIAPNRFIVFGGDITGGKIKSYRIGEITLN